MLGLFLDRNRLAVLVKFDDAIRFRIADIVAEDRRSAVPRYALICMQKDSRKALPVENVVSKNQRARVISDEVRADDERLRKAVGLFLHFVGKRHAKLRAVT